MHVLIILQFNGSKYCGFQVQKNAVSICEELQNAMEKLYGTRPPIKGCSRTDSGVHALGYCASYAQPKPIDIYKLPLALNRFLPKDIKVQSAHMVKDDFHARYSAKSKEYIYKINNSALDDVFTADFSHKVPYKLDVEEMQKAAKLLCGTNDYKAFMNIKSDIEDTVRTVYFFNIEKNGNEISFHICANGFLYNMVRIMVGTLIEVGAKRMSANDAQKAMLSKNRANAGDTAPAQGLFLYKVNY